MQATVDISRALDLLGWMSKGELLWLAEAARDKKIIVEFGSFQGRSTRALGDNTTGKIYAVDHWNGDYISEKYNTPVKDINTYVLPDFKRNLADLIAIGRVIPCRGYSDKFELPVGEQADMVFIDAGHGYNEVTRDMTKAMNLLKVGGLLCGHDFDNPGWPDVTRAVEDFCFDRHMNLKYREMIWWTRKY